MENGIRAAVRKTVFALALIVVLAVTAGRADARVREMEERQQRCDEGKLGELGASLETLAQALSKTRYAGTPEMAHELAAQVLAQAAAAKVHLAQLTCAESALDDVNRYLSQAGNYALSLARQRAAGEALTQEDAAALEEMARYGRALADAIARVEQSAADGEALSRGLSPFPQEEADPDSPFEEITALSAYPPLVYDGAYSDRETEEEAGAGRNFLKTDPSSAQKTAEALAERALTYEGELAGERACFLFSDGECTVAVDEATGGIFAALIDRETGDAAVSPDDAQRSAARFAEKAGYSSLVVTGGRAAGEEWIVTFVLQQEGVLCLADEIRAGVAMDTGEVVWFDASQFYQNHRVREWKTPALTAQEGMRALGDQVRSVQYSARVALKTPGGEADCYEYRAVGRDGERLLLYVDTQTGEEREIRFCE